MLLSLARSFERRGYKVLLAANLDEATALLHQFSPGYAVVDLKSGLLSSSMCNRDRVIEVEGISVDGSRNTWFIAGAHAIECD
jgi:ActR/RegA family two-component response regulator